MFVITGILGMMVGFGGYLFPTVRNVEDILPDHDAEHVQAPAPTQDTQDRRQPLPEKQPVVSTEPGD